MRRLLYAVPATLVGVGVGAVGVGTVVLSYKFDVPIQNAPELLLRSTRTLWAGSKITVRYKRLPARDFNEPMSEDYRERLSRVNLVGAQEMLSVCRKNKGA